MSSVRTHCSRPSKKHRSDHRAHEKSTAAKHTTLMMHPTTVVIVLLSCAILNLPGPQFTVVTGLWVGHPESPFADRMALFEHVLFNDDQWWPVLNQVIKLSVLTLPRYHLTEPYIEVLNRVQLVDPNDTEDHTVMFVIQQLMEKTPWSGTNVNFTAYALSTGVTCFTYKNVSFVLDKVINRIGFLAKKIAETKEINPINEEKKSSKEHLDLFDKVLEGVRMLFVVIVDKVAAVEGELAFFATALYDYDSADKTDNDLVLLTVLEIIFGDVNKMLKMYCGDTEDKTIYEYLGKYESLNNSPTPSDKLAVNIETLKHEVNEFQEIINSMIEVYHGLDVETMPTETWLQILDYKLPISMAIKFYIECLPKVLKKKKYDNTRSSRYKFALKSSKKNKKKKQTEDALRELQQTVSKLSSTIII